MKHLQSYFDKFSQSASQSDFLVQIQHRRLSNFLIDFSLEELVKQNASRSGKLFVGRAGRIGECSSDSNSEQTTHYKHERFRSQINPPDAGKFDESEFILSLNKDVEEKINRSGLKITEIRNLDSTGFKIEYQAKQMKGEINISGELKNEYYELKATVVEKSREKTK